MCKNLLTYYEDFRDVGFASLSVVCVGDSKGVARIIRTAFLNSIKFIIILFERIGLKKKTEQLYAIRRTLDELASKMSEEIREL